MNNLSSYIKVYNNVLSNEICRELIDTFNHHYQYQESVDNRGRPKFTQLNYSKNFQGTKVFPKLVDTFKKFIELYQKDVNIGDYQFPNTYAFEEFRIKKYSPVTNDRFDLHTDVGDYRSAKRFLAFFFYLNTVEKGGETVFPNLDISIKPETGKLLIFPPVWLFPHSGMIPLSGEKYILGSYLHYL